MCMFVFYLLKLQWEEDGARDADYRALPRCKNLRTFVAIVRVRVYYVDLFVFFVLRHW